MAKLKISLDEYHASGKPIIIELGCGPRKKPGRIGIDILDLQEVDIVADLNEGFPFLSDGSVDEIHSNSFFEHVEDLPKLLSEIVRVLKPSGKNYAFVPHFSNPYYYLDYTHNKFFGLYSFHYFAVHDGQFKRQVPNFYTNIRLKVHSIDYVFTSPFRGRRIFKKLFGTIVNSSRYTKEFYEENLCYIVPCYGLNVVFGPKN